MEKIKKISLIRSICDLVQQDPDISERQLAKKLNIGRTTVGKYKTLISERGLLYPEILQMDDDQIAAEFNVKSKKVSFLEPNWEDVRQYLQKKRLWGNQLPTVHSAWKYLYIKKLFPNYELGELPEGCMSERTFNRRYVEYLEQSGLSPLTHNANSNNNFGPASVLEIDTIGNTFPYINRKGERFWAVVFTAVLKYSGNTYAEAMKSGSSLCWASAISNAFFYFGGCAQAVRCDNDTALTNHHCKKGERRLLASIEFVLRDFNVATDICPVRSPKWKGANERSNGFLQKHFFEHNTSNEPIVADSLEELNQLFRKELLRINSIPGNHGSLSSLAIFEKYEKNALIPLPLFRPEIKSVSFGHVRQDGYVCYMHNYYFAGFENVGKDILIVNDMGKRIYLKHDTTTLKSIVDYDLDKDIVTPHYHKADKFKTQKENITGRDKTFFVTFFKEKAPTCTGIIEAIEWLFTIFSRSQQIATRLCNQIYNIYLKSPKDTDCLEAACRHILKKQNKTDLKVQLYADYNTYLKIKDMGTDIFNATVGANMLSSSQEQHSQALTNNKADNNSENSDSVRGEEYFDELI